MENKDSLFTILASKIKQLSPKLIVLICFVILVLLIIVFQFKSRVYNSTQKDITSYPTKILITVTPTPISIPTMEPSQTNSKTLKEMKDIKELKDKNAKLRYLVQGWPPANQDPKPIITYDLLNNASSSSTIRGYAFNNEFSPDGMFIGYRYQEKHKFYLMNLTNNEDIFETEDLGGPFSYIITWLLESQYALIGNVGNNSIISLANNKKLITIPHKGSGTKIFFSGDKKYLVYTFASNLFMLQDYYPSIGIVEINPASAKTIKIFEESNKQGINFICWKGHGVIYNQRVYDLPLGPAGQSLDTKTIENFVSSYNVDSGEIIKICDGEDCDKNVENLCDEDIKSQTEKEKAISQEKKQIIRQINNAIKDKLRSSEAIVLDDVTINYKQNLIAFSCKLSVKSEINPFGDPEDYVFVLGKNTSNLYKVGKGYAPRWIMN